MAEQKGVLGILISRSAGFLIFLILLAIASCLKHSINYSLYSDIVNFIIDNLNLSFVIFFTGIVAAVLWRIVFPISLIAPIASAISSMFVVTYLFRVWIFASGYVYSGIMFPVDLIYRAVFVLVIFFGYLAILAGLGKRKKKDGGKKEKREKVEKFGKESINWDEIGGQFKLALYNLGSSLKNMFEPKKKTNKKGR